MRTKEEIRVKIMNLNQNYTDPGKRKPDFVIRWIEALEWVLDEKGKRVV